jgi:hypothetical protein
MSGALLQLVAIGAQDAMLMQNSEITFFRLETRKHSNFSIEAIDQTVNGTPGFERSISCTISRNGDLINRVYVEAKLPKLSWTGGKSNNDDNSGLDDTTHTWIPNVGAHLIDHADIEIGGQRIDRHYGQWLSIWNELTGDKSHKHGYDRMIGNKPNLLNPYWKNGSDTSVPTATTTELRNLIESDTVIVPLAFWFCRSPGLALPLIALQYHEVKLNITFAKMTNLLRTWVADEGAASPVIQNEGYFKPFDDDGFAVTKHDSLEVKLWVDYCFLDNDERRFMATKPHKYLIEQLQYSGKEAIRGGSDRFRLNFNHPTKMLVWCVESNNNYAGVYSYPGIKKVTENARGMQYGQANDLNNAEEGIWCGRNPIASGKLVLNGHDRFKEREGPYFDTVQTYQHMNNTPQRPGINMFSFGLRPAEFQPSGSINMSRLDNATLDLKYHEYANQSSSNAGSNYYNNATVSIFATSYNQLRIISGMGGLTYSN